MTRGRGRLAGPGLLAGVAFALSLPPVGIWGLAIVGAALLQRRLVGLHLRSRVLVGFAAGVGLNGPSLFWATGFSGPGYVAMVIIESLMMAVAAGFVAPRRGRALAFPAVLTLLTFVRDSAPLGGLPIGGIPLGQADGPLLGAARLGGPLLLTALVALAGVAVGELVAWARPSAREAAGRSATGPQQGPLLASLLALLLVVATAAAGSLAPDGGPGVRAIRAAVVQGGGRRGLRQSQVDPHIIFRAQLAASARLRPPLDLVLWPEDVMALDQPLATSPEAAAVAALARRLHTTVVAGITLPVGSSQFLNQVVGWAPSGEVVARFEKVHRVPFGEYVPARSFFSHLADLSAVPRDAIPGKGPGILRTPAGPLDTMVSWEVFFAHRGRVGLRAGGTLMIVPTNTSSYSGGQVPSQEIAASRLQAVAGGRDLLQAAPTGYSAVIDHRGTVVARTPLGSQQVIERTVWARRGQTVFDRLGQYPFVALGAAGLVAAWAAALWDRRRRRRSPSSG